MLGLDIIDVYLLLPCLVWTAMWYINCCHAWFGQQCGIFTVVMLGLDNNVAYLQPSMATVNMPHCCPNQAWQQ
jgi:hypothetical protein